MVNVNAHEAVILKSFVLSFVLSEELLDYDKYEKSDVSDQLKAYTVVWRQKATEGP